LVFCFSTFQVQQKVKKKWGAMRTIVNFGSPFTMGKPRQSVQIQNSSTGAVLTEDEESKNDLEPRKSKLAWGGLGKMLKFRSSFTMGRPLQNVETFSVSLDSSASAPTGPSFSAGVTSVHSK
jgi:hypothetical protein